MDKKRRYGFTQVACIVFAKNTKWIIVHVKNTFLGNKTSSSLTEAGGFVFYYIYLFLFFSRGDYSEPYCPLTWRPFYFFIYNYPSLDLATLTSH